MMRAPLFYARPEQSKGVAVVASFGKLIAVAGYVRRMLFLTGKGDGARLSSQVSFEIDTLRAYAVRPYESKRTSS